MGPTGYALVAAIRARELRTRIVLACVIALTAYGVAPTIWPVVWLVLVVAGQLADRRLNAPLLADPAAPVDRGRQVLLCVSIAINTTIYSAISAYLWFEGGIVGQVFTMIQVAGGLLHVSLHMHHVRPLLLSALVPHAAYFLGLPLISAFAGQPWMAVGALGGLLYCAHLAKAVKQSRLAYAELEAARARAERASDAKSDFLATVSHEIRTPMNAVISAAELLRRTDLTTEQGEHVAMLQDASDVLMGLLNDVLDISKIEAGKMRLEDADLDLPQKLGALTRLWEPRARDKGVALVVELAPDLPERIRTDPLRLQQILFNLLSNAVKFTDRGSITVRAGRAETEQGERLRFDIVDTGCGMTAETMARLFTGFEQAEAGTTRRYGGTGLGLTISRRLAEMMGGALTAESTPGRGSVFRLDLPLMEADGAVEAEAAPVEVGPAGLRALKVLAAEDHAVNRRILGLFLEPLGCRLTLAENGRDAVQTADVEVFDVILMDMQMPVMDGLEAARTIRAGKGPNARTPIVALTANALDHHRAAWAAVGVEAFLTKPIDPRALTAALLGAASVARPSAERAA